MPGPYPGTRGMGHASSAPGYYIINSPPCKGKSTGFEKFSRQPGSLARCARPLSDRGSRPPPYMVRYFVARDDIGARIMVGASRRPRPTRGASLLSLPLTREVAGRRPDGGRARAATWGRTYKNSSPSILSGASPKKFSILNYQFSIPFCILYSCILHFISCLPCCQPPPNPL